MTDTDNKELFNKLKTSLLNFDPVAFAEHYLTLDGKPFRLHGNGYKPMADIYRYVGTKALEPNAKPMIIVKSRQTSATTMASVLEMYFMGSGLFGTGDRPPIRVIHTFPQLELAAAYSKTKLNQMISASIPSSIMGSNGKQKSYMQSKMDTGATSDSNSFKQFQNGNHLWIESIGLDADRIMGRSADVLFVDEVQRTTDLAIGNALKILTTAKYGRPSKGVQVFFGTPRKKGTGFHKMWQQSSQQYYHLGCEKCEKHFPLYTPESTDWEKVWLHGFIVKCTICGHEQDKRQAAERGKWVSTKDPNDPETKMIGFHINILYMPMFTREDVESEKPGKHPVNTERVFQNEVMGEFFAGDSSPITAEEIRDLCGDHGRKFSSSFTPDQIPNQIAVLGIDYGAKADIEQLANENKSSKTGLSYSTVVVLLSKGPGLLSIEYAAKMKKNDPEYKTELIAKLIRDYNIQLAVGDIGFSNDFSYNMAMTHGDRYIVSRAQGKVTQPNHIKYSSDVIPKEVLFEKSFYYGELFDQMKKGMVRFPMGDYEKIAWLIEHCSSMEIKPSISKFGEHTINYVKGGTPNDGIAALLNAYLAYKFIISKGFTNNNPGLNFDPASHNKPMVLSGYVPKRF